MTIEAPSAPSAPSAPAPPASDEEALFPEARRLRRRRWTVGIVVAALLAGIAALVALTVARGDAAKTVAVPAAPGLLPVGPYATLHVAGPLAVSPTGALYVADAAEDRVLVRVPGGRFRVVAGDGRAGFSGDGGPAVHARLVGISDLAFSPDGRLYIADGGHVRVVGRNGVINTIAGSGRGPVEQKVRSGTPARAAALGPALSLLDSAPLSVAVSPTGQLYISTGAQILRLTANGKLVGVRAVMTSGPYAGHPLGDFGPIAIDDHGNIDVAGVNGWAIWQVSPNGSARQIGSAAGARRSGGDDSVLERGPGGAVFGEDGPAVLRVDRARLATAFTFGNRRVNGEYFWLTYFAFGPGGITYADEIPGGSAFETQQQLVSVRDSHVSLLWQQAN